MACAKISDWDWKKGNQTSIDLGSGAKIPLNYFSCGTYYFDGEFQVVKFPKGMQLYHGSGNLSNANVEFPVGIDFYRPYNISSTSKINKNDLIQDLINKPDQSVAFESSKFIQTSPAWFGNSEIATFYSAQNPTYFKSCGTKCISAYELKEDCVFLLLNNNFNLWRFLNDSTIPEVNKQQLRFMFNLSEVEAEYSDTEFGNINIKRKRRRSFRDVDIPFTKWLCSYLPKDYAGYAANTPVEKKKHYFHLEFMFCNPIRWLKRNLTNSIDWQHSNFNDGPVEISRLLNQMALYKSMNVDFHAGNLLEHSIWSLLFAEQLVLNTPKYGIPSLDIQKKIAALAFIHDIGKMAPNNENVVKRKQDCVYFSIPEHPQIGSDYILGLQHLPLLDDNMNQVGFLNIVNLLSELGFMEADIPGAAKIVDLHWEFGSYLQMWKGFHDMATVDAYINRVGNDEPFAFFYALIIVSVADILASQPYGVNNLTAELNHHSRFFSFISNVPKKYRGGDLVDVTSEKRNSFSDCILKRVYERGTLH